MSKCKNCGAELVVHAVPRDPMAMNTAAGQDMVGACSVCGSRDYQDIVVDQMQGCRHGNLHQLTTGSADGPNGYPRTSAPDPRDALITALKSMLRELEWADRDPIHGDECPICGFKPETGHAPDCRLKALLDA